PVYPSIFRYTCSVSPLYLHSFPTRRSSDLGRYHSPASIFSYSVMGIAPLSKAGGHLAARSALLSQPSGLGPLSPPRGRPRQRRRDRKSTRLNSSHVSISYAVFCLKKKKDNN